MFAATAHDTTPWGGAAPLQPFATPSLPLVQPERVLVPRPENSLSPEELLNAPVDAATSDWITNLQNAVRDDPDFGSVAISEDRITVTLTWFGDPSATLREQIDAAPAKLRVVVQAADFRPAELQELVRESMQPGLVPGIQVTTGGAENDGSGLQLGISELPAGQTLQDVGHDIATALDRTDVPITVEVTGQVIAFTGSS
ncbi:hypothetical protein APR04_000740 [Promicromonospora umidemergens]|uniref:Efflux RND transporter permease subunit n=1 Tax=Promicromonospora umidemergens TaxID=629679 RepID=A0ABP8XQ04_9MICO|nr:hypothetical protein [Promicromonospora umidemergens]